MVDLKEKIDMSRLPRHLAIIMDGNGRWAKKQNQPRIFGHRNGVKAVREVSEAAAELGIGFLTLYAFSTENWNRPMLEVNALMSLLVETIRKEVSTLMENKIRLRAIGDLSKLPDKTLAALQEGMEITRENDRMTLTLALNYSARWEIMEAVKKIHWDATKGLDSEKLTEEIFRSYLTTHDLPDPELLIRTSGEKRISNFLLWQIAYTELYFTETFWPDFRKNDLYMAIIDFQNRERRFGKISEQLV